MQENTENSMETAKVVGKPFPKGVSGNPGGRPRGLYRGGGKGAAGPRWRRHGALQRGRGAKPGKLPSRQTPMTLARLHAEIVRSAVDYCGSADAPLLGASHQLHQQA